MTGFLLRADDILRRRTRTVEAGGVPSSLVLLAVNVAVFGMIYGAVLGTFGGVGGERIWQVIYAAVKVPLLLSVTFLIGLPSFFVLNTLLGLRRDFAEAIRALVATQAGLAIVLASLAPLTAVWYASSGSYAAALRFNLLMFAVASLGAQVLLRGYYRPLIRRNRRHRWMLWTWLVIYAFVGVQMAWTLRPFVGDPNADVQFFRREAWGNAYVVVADLIRGLF
ncbi:MAG: hypothetical protein HQ567_22095 [Candidatus Nealsonbacteria bacterium]|nr:hypothetical protein [Candidatus Nealsonbacteria bacterium]